MKKSILSLAAIGICLTSCGKESDFKKAIGKKLDSKPLCLSTPYISDSTYGVNDDEEKKLKEKYKDTLKIYTQRYKDNSADKISDSEQQRLDQLNALVNAGLLTTKIESLPTYDWNKKPDGGYYKYTFYILTDAGNATRAKEDVNAMGKLLFGDNGNRVFCYAKPEVDSILNYTEANNGGYQMAEVKYSYKYVDVADWAKTDAIQKAFPEINKELNDSDKTGKIGLVKTNNGWSTDL